MIFVDNEGITDPRVNLAIEEFLLRRLETEEDVLLFYINQPSIILGRYQNTLEEINREYVERHGIYVVRRLSGGGAVFHDLGNLNFSFITQNRPENFRNFKKFTAPVIAALQALGVPAELSGRSDILVEGRKISGNAQYITGKRMVSHGTLLFDSDLSRVSAALNPKPEKITSKGIKSVRSRVANIVEYLDRPVDVESFRAHLLRSIFAEAGGEAAISQYHLTADDWSAIQALTQERYATWEWNWGRSPDCSVQKTRRFEIGEIDARIDVHKGHIRAIQFCGDFFTQGDLAELERRLTGARYDRAGLADALQGVDVMAFFEGITSEGLVEFLY